MNEPVVGMVMTRSPVSVTPEASFKQVACALLAAETCAVPVVSDGIPIGVVSEYDVLVNLEFHGGVDQMPLIGTSAARRRRRKARAATARELMCSPSPTISSDASIGAAARRLADPARPALCVVDDQLRLIGLVTRRDLLEVFRRPDAEIAAEVRVVVERDRRRPTRDLAELTVRVISGVVELEGMLVYRSQVEHAALVVSRVAGVVAVRNNLTYDIDDLHVTGF
ncbi:CBS domain-containing protein [Kribbella sp. NPDC000426]|uniref:CBS domain-containing protein n=1 Tax=Kribbella sp. NPDC000426 TaxID=3154255 RepID=UPI00332AA2ED